MRRVSLDKVHLVKLLWTRLVVAPNVSQYWSTNQSSSPVSSTTNNDHSIVLRRSGVKEE